MHFLVAFIASAAIFGSASAACDNTTAAKVQECVFKSDLFDPAKLPSDEASTDSYCNGNATINCLSTTMGECNDDDRQMGLMKNLVTVDAVMKGQMYLCANRTAFVDSWDCLQDLASTEFQDCVTAAVGQITNTATDEDLKARLDNMCTFFDAYAACFEGEGIQEVCKMVVKNSLQMSVNGIRYGYCSKDAAGKKAVIDDYNAVGSSSAITASIVTIFIAYLISLLN